MGWLSPIQSLLRGGSGEASDLSLVNAFLRDLGAGPVSSTGTDRWQALERLSEAVPAALEVTGRLVILDWDEEPRQITEDVGAALQSLPDLAEPADLRDEAVRVGLLASVEGKRGSGVLPTLAALDRSLMPCGHRLLWIELGRSDYAVMVVTAAAFARWHDVALTRDVAVLQCAERNAVPRGRQLSSRPRPGPPVETA